MIIHQILTRIYVDDMDNAVDFYEKLFQKKCALRFSYKEVDVELAQVDHILMLCGSEEALKPFRDTKATFLVDSVRESRDYLLKNGATIIRDIKKVPTGTNMTMMHPDGAIIEYIEFNKE